MILLSSCVDLISNALGGVVHRKMSLKFMVKDEFF